MKHIKYVKAVSLKRSTSIVIVGRQLYPTLLSQIRMNAWHNFWCLIPLQDTSFMRMEMTTCVLHAVLLMKEAEKVLNATWKVRMRKSSIG